VWIKPGTGKIIVNGRDQEVYFARPTLRLVINQPFGVTEREGQYDVIATVKGGGLSGQAGAVKHGIAQALSKYEPALRSSVCWPTMGNHEGFTSKGKDGVGPYYDAFVMPRRAEVGGLASGTEAYYSFDWANIHFICLNSHDVDRKPGGPMAKWLKADLEKAKADWLIAFWHHPPYTKGSHDSDKEKDMTEMRHDIMPIIESGGVDLVLAGHSHIYERSMLIDMTAMENCRGS